VPLISLQDSLTAVLGEITERQAMGGTHLIGISSGIRKIDEAIGGFRGGSTYVIAGATGSGKSSLALNISEAAAALKHRVLYVSLEMDARLLVLRMLSGMTRVPALRIEYGQMNDSELKLVQSKKETISEWKFNIYDDPIRVNNLVETISKIYIEHGIDLMVLDQISLVISANPEGQTQRMAEVVMRISELCRAINIPIIELAWC
jgi:replicative DNA helicase